MTMNYAEVMVALGTEVSRRQKLIDALQVILEQLPEDLIVENMIEYHTHEIEKMRVAFESYQESLFGTPEQRREIAKRIPRGS